VFRALVTTTFKHQTHVEIQWYSGEEAGLLGSQAVAKSYNFKSSSTTVMAFLELDMSADFKPGSKDAIALEAPGYPTGMPVTGNGIQNIHPTGNMMSVLAFSWRHPLEPAKVALAYAYER
ncbi:hypothetical protein TRAPUB_8582, partial [Trametes pubescens]